MGDPIEASHCEIQVIPLKPSLWCCCTLLTTSGNEVVHGVALFWMLVLHGVLRPAHRQRSKILEISVEGINGRASSGKEKQIRMNFGMPLVLRMEPILLS